MDTYDVHRSNTSERKEISLRFDCTVNGDKLQALRVPVLLLEAKRSCGSMRSSGSMRRATREASPGLPRDFFFEQRPKMSCECETAVGGKSLTSCGALDKRAPPLPKFVAVQLERYTGPAWMPTIPVETA